MSAAVQIVWPGEIAEERRGAAAATPSVSTGRLMRSAARRYATMSAPASAAHPLRLAVAALLPHRLALIALTLFVVAGIVFSDIGISVNGPYQRYLGIANIAYVLGDVSLFPDDHNKFYGAAFEAPLVLVERALRLEDSRDIFCLAIS